MDMMDLLKIGAGMIQNNSDDATTGLDSSLITGALGNLLGGGASGGGLDLGSIIGSMAGGDDSSGLSETIGSWIGNGDNQPLEASQVGSLISDDKVTQFAEELGISEESARQALADALPEVVNQATPDGDTSLLGSLLEQVGGIDGAMNLAGKFLR